MCNERRAEAVGLTPAASSFFNQDVLSEDAPADQRVIAAALAARSRERVARAHHASKDKRLGTSLSKFEALAAVLPSVRAFERLRYEGDLETSERNELLLCILAEYIREKPKVTGDLLKGDTVSGQVSGVRVIVEDHLGRVLLAPSGGMMLRKALQQMRYEDGPRADRKLLAPLRAAHFERLAAPDCPFDIDSPGWPMARWALLLTMHQCLLRGGEPGRLARDVFRPALGICWAHLVWLDEATMRFATVLNRDTGQRHWLLTILVRSIKDTKGRFKRVPIKVVSLHPTSQGLGDPLCPYTAIRRLWCARAHLVPDRERATSPFFVGPDGQQAVDTEQVTQAVRTAAVALGLNPLVFGAAACRRGGATDLRDGLGAAAAKHIIKDRGRWCDTGDIDDIYARASLEEHAAASIRLAGARPLGLSLEEASTGWVQPARWRRS